MEKKSNLIAYLPEFLRDIREYKALALVEDHEINHLWEKIGDAFHDQTVKYATEYGVSKLEEMLHITPKGTQDDRKIEILTRLSKQLPYTIKKLKEILIGLCGPDGFTLEVYPEKYTVKVAIGLTKKNQINSVDTMIRQICPANMLCLVTLKYNIYEDLAKYTYGQLKLKKLSYEEMREGILEELMP